MIEVDPRSSQGVYDTLLELRLQDWAHEKDPKVRTQSGIKGGCFAEVLTLMSSSGESGAAGRGAVAAPERQHCVR